MDDNSLEQTLSIMASISELSTNEIEHVLTALPLADVCALCPFAPNIDEAASSVLKQRVKTIEDEFLEEIDLINNGLRQIANEPPDLWIRFRSCLLRCYHATEMALHEYRTLRAFTRPMFEHCRLCPHIAKLLEHLKEIHTNVQARSIPPWTMTTDVSNKLVRDAKIFYETFDKEQFCEGSPFGARIVDILDCLLDTILEMDLKFVQDIKYAIINSTYILSEIKYLPNPPTISKEIGNGKRKPTLNEKLNLLDYLYSFVLFNNRILLKEEQYWREEEIKRTAENPKRDCPLLTRPPRAYPKTRNCCKRSFHSRDSFFGGDKNPSCQSEEKQNDPNCIICETYSEKNTTFNPEKDLKITTHLTCPIDEAPYKILDSWCQLHRSELVNEKKDENNEEDCCETNHKKESTSITYTFKLEISLPPQVLFSPYTSIIFQDYL